MLERLAKHLHHYRAIWSALILLVLVWSGWYGSSIFNHLETGSLLAKDAPSQQVVEQMNEQFPAAQPSLVMLVEDANQTVDDAAYQTALVDLTKQVTDAGSDVKILDSYAISRNPALVSADRHVTYLPISILGPKDERIKVYRAIKEAVASSPLTIKIGGQAAVTDDLMTQIEADLHHAEFISFGLLAILLLLVFRSVASAAVPLVVGASSILISLALVRLYTRVGDISVFAINVITFLGLGLAIDYSLFMISRFREERRKTPDTLTALRQTMTTAGRTVCFSGTIVMVSLLGLCFFQAPFLKSVGIGGALGVAVTVTISLIALPIMLSWLGPNIEWGRLGKIKEAPDKIWDRLGRFVIKRAGWVVILVLGALVALGVPFLRVNLSQTDATSLPTTFTSRQAIDDLHHYFPATDTTPISIVVTLPDDELTASDRQDLAVYADQVRSVAGVTKVGDLSDLAAYPAAAQAKYQKMYVNGRYALLTVTTDDRDQKGIVRDIRALAAPAELKPLVGGSSAQLVDLLAEIEVGLLPAGLVIIVTTFVVLLFMLGSLLVPLKAVLLNALSLSASFGLLTLIFQDGHLSRWLNFQSNGSVEAALPMIIFAIAFGLAMDYEVFLVSRIKEKVDQGGDTTEAVVYGLRKTGSIINSAALLLLVVIGAFATSQVLSIKEISVGLVIAVLIDVLLVRTLLVPATMYFLGEYNWWLPKWLRRLVERVGLKH